MIIKEPKTKKSERIIALPKFLEEDIKLLTKAHLETRLRLGSDYINSKYLIHNAFGEALKPNRCNDRLNRFLKKNNIEHITLHQLRHTNATILNYFGKDIKEISRQLVHSNLTTTLNVYTHIFEQVSVSSKNIATDMDDFYKKASQK